MSSVIQESFDWRTKYRCIRETFFRYVENKMKTIVKTILKIFAILIFLAGGIWFLQGINILPGSFMTGDPQW